MSWLVRGSACVVFGLALALTPAAIAQETGTKEDKKKTDEKKESAAKPVFVGYLTGTVKSIKANEEKGNSIQVEVTTISPEVVNQFRRYGSNRMTEWGFIDGDGGRLPRNRLGGRDNGSTVVPRETKQTFQLAVTDQTKIRIPPKPEVDENGKPVKKPQLKRDKNDPEYGLPGVKGELTDLHAGQIVRVAVGQMRDPKDKNKIMVVCMQIELWRDSGEQQQPPRKP